MRIKNLLFLITFLLILFNVYTILEWDLIESRWVRIISVTILGGCSARISALENRFLLIAFFLFLLCDFFLLWYEIDIAKYFYFGIHSLAYLFILFHIKSEIKKPKFNLLQNIYFIAIILINSYLFYKVASIFSEEIEELGLEILFYIHGLITVAMVMAAFSFWDNRVNRASIVLFMSILSLALSDVIMFSAYYIELKEMYYLERGLYVIGLAGLARFSALYQNEPIKEENF
ncbi:lysoplasmalogenase family protein [Zunongwangia sp. F260]|uniref:Lysoplasmalogenase family protein n=1 Tax=Autumnicola lenta TaxID=3075593 RepID=A0ABU3CJC8_9FLAO|nr:lysoplasmalogenase family protein [Zunongwangia sp. F260]MDT0646454.1 lysoplasmalogenase family protein [Zunongwangia sp. F260]